MAAEARRRVIAAGHARVGLAIRRDHRRRHGAPQQRDARTVPRHLRQPVGHRRPLLGAVVLRHGAGRADGRSTSIALLAGARAMESACRVATARENPGLALGAFMAAGVERGRDKLTLLLPPRLAVVRPVGRAARRREHRQAGQRHRADRRRVAPACRSATTASSSSSASAMSRRSGASLDRPEHRARRCVDDSAARRVRARRGVPALGGRDGDRRAADGINPFDEPNVKQAKDATRALLEAYQQQQAAAAARAARGDRRRPADAERRRRRQRSLARPPTSFLTRDRTGDYFGLLAFLPPDDEPLRRSAAGIPDERSGTRAAAQRCSDTVRAISTRPASCTKAAPTTACSSSSSPTADEDLAIPGSSVLVCGAGNGAGRRRFPIARSRAAARAAGDSCRGAIAELLRRVMQSIVDG